jgi:UrcA family protein
MNTFNRTKLYTAIYCALGIAALGAFSTSVNATEIPPSETVRFGDLNISHMEGAKVLYGRIHAAARKVCKQSGGTDPVLRLADKACIETAVDDAVRKVNAPVLTALRFGNEPIRLANK